MGAALPACGGLRLRASPCAAIGGVPAAATGVNGVRALGSVGSGGAGGPGGGPGLRGEYAMEGDREEAGDAGEGLLLSALPAGASWRAYPSAVSGLRLRRLSPGGAGVALFARHCGLHAHACGAMVLNSPPHSVHGALPVASESWLPAAAGAATLLQGAPCAGASAALSHCNPMGLSGAKRSSAMACKTAPSLRTGAASSLRLYARTVVPFPALR